MTTTTDDNGRRITVGRVVQWGDEQRPYCVLCDHNPCECRLVHAPNDNWVVVSGNSARDKVIVMHAMCICGDDDCGWTATAGSRDFVNQHDHGMTREHSL